MVESKALAAALCVARTTIEPIIGRGLVARQSAEGKPVIGYRTTVYPIPVMVWRMTCLPSHYACEVKPGEPVALGDVITLEAADALLAAELETACGHVADMVTNETLSTDQVAALISFVHDCGPDEFATSHVLQYINAGDVDAASDELEWWSAVWTRTGLKENAERLRLRRAEQELLTGETGEAR
jgi:GH24 family phage-related lysozyme (muramidase)